MKKIAGDSKSSTFAHPSGHKMVIAHDAVSALQRKQLESLPIHHLADGGPVTPTAPKSSSDTHQAPGGWGEPNSPGERLTKWVQGLAGGHAKGGMINRMADGGSVKKDDVPEPNKQNAAAMQKGATSGGPSAGEAWSNLKSGLGLADGGNVGEDIPYDKLIPQEAAENAPYGTSPIPEAKGPMVASNGPVTPDQVAQMPGGPGVTQPDEPAAGSNSPESPPPTVQSDGSLMPASGNFAEAYQQGQTAISEQQKINETKAKADADVQSQDLLNRQSLNQGVQQNLKDFSAHQQQFLNDYAADHIDPKHYVENMGAVNKIATGIGLFLGGFSTAFTHGSNPAMDFLNKQIDRDIEAQQSRMDKEKTVLGANQQLFNDKMLASNQTRVNMNDIYDHKIQLAATKLGTPQAKAMADQAHAQFAIQNNGLLQQNAIRSAVMQHMQNGGGGLSATDLAAAGYIPQQDAIKEQQSIDSQKKALSSAGEIFRKYDKEQTAGNLINPQSYARANDLNAQLTNLIMESDASKRLTPESAALEVKPFWVNTTDDETTRNDKLAGIGNLIRQHAAPTPYMSRYAPKSLPQYDQSVQSVSMEGKTATNPKTGQRIVMRDGQWVPLAK